MGLRLATLPAVTVSSLIDYNFSKTGFAPQQAELSIWMTPL
jgi:hypothetical protein